MWDAGGGAATRHNKVEDGATGVAVCMDKVEGGITVKCGGPGTLSSQTKEKAQEKPDQTQTTAKTHQHHH